MKGVNPPDNGASEPSASDRLDSWKEIAAYLRRDESTVRRWEKSGLPVRRHHHKVRAAVFAYKSELDAWWNNGKAVAESTPVSDSSRPLLSEPAAGQRRAAWRVEWPSLVWAAAAGALVIVVAVLAIQLFTRDPASASPRITPFTSYTGSFRMPSFSPDGERIAFSWTGPSAQGNRDIYVKMIGAGQPLRLTSDASEDNAPAWSPDGKQIAFIRDKDPNVALYVINALGGPERKLIDLPWARYFNLQWTRDGKSLIFAEKTSPNDAYDSLHFFAIFQLSLDTLQKRQLTFPTDPESDHRFAISPDGATLAFLRQGFQSGVGIFMLPLDGGEPRLVHIEKAWVGHVAWNADGRSLLFTSMREGGNKMWRISTAGGEPELIAITEESAWSPSVAPTGKRLAYVRDYFDVDLMRVELIANGAAKEATPFAASARLETVPAFSPDGRKIAFFSEQSGRRELWMSNADGTSPEQLTDFFAWSSTPPAWSPDGRRLVFSSRAPGDGRLVLLTIDVATKELRRLRDTEDYFMPQLTRDGRWIFATRGELDDYQMFKLPAEGGAAVPIGGKGALMPRESPDGRYLYYLKHAGGLWRMPAGGGEESLVLPDVLPSLWNNWCVVQDGIYYVKPQTPFTSTLAFHSFSTSAISRTVTTFPGAPLLFEGGITISPDGKWAVYSQLSRSASDIMLVENFR